MAGKIARRVSSSSGGSGGSSGSLQSRLVARFAGPIICAAVLFLLMAVLSLYGSNRRLLGPFSSLSFASSSSSSSSSFASSSVRSSSSVNQPAGNSRRSSWISTGKQQITNLEEQWQDTVEAGAAEVNDLLLSSGVAAGAVAGDPAATGDALVATAGSEEGDPLPPSAPTMEEVVAHVCRVERTVILVSVATEDIALARSWFTSVLLVGFSPQVIFLADGKEAYNKLARIWPMQTLLLQQGKGGATVQELRRLQVADLLLSRNVTVFIDDVRNVWLSNPRWSLKPDGCEVYVAAHVPEGILVENPNALTCHPLPLEYKPSLAGGLSPSYVVLLPSQRSRQLLQQWARSLEQASAQGRPTTNHNAFNRALKPLMDENPESVGVLTPCLFPSAAMFFNCSSSPSSSASLASEEEPSCRRHGDLLAEYQHACRGGMVHPSVVLGSELATQAATVRRLAAHRLWFAPDCLRLMALGAGRGPAAAAAEADAAAVGTPAVVARLEQLLPGSGRQPADGGLTLAEAVEKVGGPERKLIFCSASGGYLDFLLNWFGSVQKVGWGPRVLFIAEDRVAYDFLRERWPQQTVLIAAEDEQAAVAAAVEKINGTADGSSAHAFGSATYNSVVDRRPLYFEALVLLNVTFLYNDVDIVWFRDPFSFFAGEFDVVAQDDRPRTPTADESSASLFSSTDVTACARSPAQPICTCIVFVHPTKGSLILVRLWSELLHVMQRREGGRGVPNQPAFNAALHLSRANVVSVGVLPMHLFPSGYLYFPCDTKPGCEEFKPTQEEFWRLKKRGLIRPVMLHNNWIRGHMNKLKRFVHYRLWKVKRREAALAYAAAGAYGSGGNASAARIPW